MVFPAAQLSWTLSFPFHDSAQRKHCANICSLEDTGIVWLKLPKATLHLKPPSTQSRQPPQVVETSCPIMNKGMQQFPRALGPKSLLSQYISMCHNYNLLSSEWADQSNPVLSTWDVASLPWRLHHI